MKVEFSKTFIKAASKLSGKTKESLQKAILEVEQADNINKITDCKKNGRFQLYLSDSYRKLSGFFIFHVQIKDDVVLFQYLLSRGEAYSKKNEESLRLKDR